MIFRADPGPNYCLKFPIFRHFPMQFPGEISGNSPAPNSEHVLPEQGMRWRKSGTDGLEPQK